MDWEPLSGVAGFIMWLLFVALKKRKQQRSAAQPDRAVRKRRRPRRSRERYEFERDYEPIEPA